MQVRINAAIMIKKRPIRNLLYLSFSLALLTGCTEQDGQLQSIRQQLAATQDANKAASFGIQELNQQLAGRRRQISGQASKRAELEATVQRSGATEQTLVRHRTGLEESLNQLSGSVAAYRKEFLTP